MISIEAAKARQVKMYDTAQAILAHYNIEVMLDQLGEVHQVGSFAYSLMVRPDIDFLVYAGEPAIEPLLRIATMSCLLMASERYQFIISMYGQRMRVLRKVCT